MRKVALLLCLVSLCCGSSASSPQRPKGNRGGAPASTAPTAAAATKKNVIASAPVSSITVLSFPTAQNVYIVPSAQVYNPQSDPTQFTREEYLAGRTPVQVVRPAGHYYVVVKQSPGGSYRADGEDNHVYVFPDGGQVQTDAKIYSINHSSDQRSFVSSLIWPESMSGPDFMKTLPSKALFTIPEGDLTRIKTLFEKNSIDAQQGEWLLALLRTTGKAVWHGENRLTNVYACYGSLGANGEPKDLTLLPE